MPKSPKMRIKCSQVKKEDCCVLLHNGAGTRETAKEFLKKILQEPMASVIETALEELFSWAQLALYKV